MRRAAARRGRFPRTDVRTYCDMMKQKPVVTRVRSRRRHPRVPATHFRPEIDEIRGVDCDRSSPLLDRDLIRIRQEGRAGAAHPLRTTNVFLEFFASSRSRISRYARETELNEESRRVVEHELGDVLESHQPADAEAAFGSPTRRLRRTTTPRLRRSTAGRRRRVSAARRSGGRSPSRRATTRSGRVAVRRTGGDRRRIERRLGHPA